MAMTKTKRRRMQPIGKPQGARFTDLAKLRLINSDKRSHAEFLADMRAKQAAGKLANPATAALLDRLERAI